MLLVNVNIDNNVTHHSLRTDRSIESDQRKDRADRKFRNRSNEACIYVYG